MKKVWIVGLFTLLCSSLVQAGEIVVKQFDVKDYYRLRVFNNFDIVHQQSADSAGVVVVMADEEIMESVTCVNKKGQLTIRCKSVVDKEQMQGTIILYSNALEEVENNGLGSISVASPLSGSKFKAKVVGNGSIVVSQLDYDKVEATVLTGNGIIGLGGSCREASLKVTGAGQIEADDLKAQDVSCRISGNGVIGCYAIENLKAWVTGRGEVYYRGTPAIKKSSLGELVVRSLEGNDE